MSTTHQVIRNSNATVTEQPWISNSPFQLNFLRSHDNESKTDPQKHIKSDSVDTVEFAILIVILVLSLGATLSNGAILLASKFTSGGETPALIYVRSFCVADCMTGVYGLLKVTFILGQPQWINCFLSESIFFSSLTASNLLLVNLSTNTLFHLTKPHKLDQLMDKKSTITNMVFLWNGAFLVGFAPLMGWHLSDSGCMFFTYYDIYYILFLMLIFLGCMASTLMLLKRVNNVLEVSTLQAFKHRDLVRIQTVLLTCKLDLCWQFISQFPLVIYMLLNCQVCALHEINTQADLILLCFIPPILIKAVVAAAIHGSRTTPIWQVLTSFILGHLLQLRTKHLHVQHKYSDAGQTQPEAGNNQPLRGISIVSFLANSNNHMQAHSTFNSDETTEASDDDTMVTLATPRGSLDSMDILNGVMQTTTFITTQSTPQQGDYFSGSPFRLHNEWHPCPVHGVTMISPGNSRRSSFEFTSASMTGCQFNHSSSNTTLSNTFCESKCIQIHCQSCPAHPNNLKNPPHQYMLRRVHNMDYFGNAHAIHTEHELVRSDMKSDSRRKLRRKGQNTNQKFQQSNGHSNYLSPAILSAHNLSHKDLAARNGQPSPFQNLVLT